MVTYGVQVRARTCEQVEAEWGEERPSGEFKDPLLAALEQRKNVLKAEKGETRFVQMAKRSVELASTAALGSPLVSELAVDSIVHLVRALCPPARRCRGAAAHVASTKSPTPTGHLALPRLAPRVPAAQQPGLQQPLAH